MANVILTGNTEIVAYVILSVSEGPGWRGGTRKKAIYVLLTNRPLIRLRHLLPR